MANLTMTPELWSAVALAVVGLGLVFTQQLYNDFAKGAAWALGNREDQELNPVSARFERAVNNHLQNAMMFLPIALVVALTGQGTQVTAIAAAVFVIARVGHSVTYALGVTHIRSGFWMAGIIATGVTGWPLVKAIF